MIFIKSNEPEIEDEPYLSKPVTKGLDIDTCIYISCDGLHSVNLIKN